MYWPWEYTFLEKNSFKVSTLNQKENNMIIEQIYTGCLAQGAYYIESEGEAVVIDPLRDSAPYLQRLNASGAKLKYVLETHFHADFVSGHLDLAREANATIVFSDVAKPKYAIHGAKDGEILKVGKVSIKVLHTPGHTLESACYLLLDENQNPHAIFTGDTLFLGDVGRPDLAAKSALTVQDLAGLLYDSLHSKILPLPDDLIIYPGHGAGSACGKMMSNDTVDTLGRQRVSNYALQPQTKEAFVEAVTEGLSTPPAYFPLNVRLNKEGYDKFSDVKKRGMVAFKPTAFKEAAESTDALLLDTRSPQSFAAGHIPRSINIGIDGGFAPWAGALISDEKHPILIIADEGRADEVVMRLSRVGFDNTIGFLEGGFDAWKKEGLETDFVETITAQEFAEKLSHDKSFPIFDVRKPTEYIAGHIATGINYPLDGINLHMQQINENSKAFVHCAGGYRSMIFISILKSRGFHHFIDIKGGYSAIKESNLFELKA